MSRRDEADDGVKVEKELPFFSIIISTYMRPQPLADCLRAMTEVDYPRNRMEIIVVDDGSVPSSDVVVSSFVECLPVRCVVQGHAGPAAARNRGAFRFHLLRSRRRRQHIRFEPIPFYCSLLSHAFKVCRGAEALALASVLGLTQIATVFGFVRQRFEASSALEPDS